MTYNFTKLRRKIFDMLNNFQKKCFIYANATFILVCLVVLPGCNSPSELTRSKASELFKATNEFKQPVTIILVTDTEKDGLWIDKSSASETLEDGKARALQSQLNRYPKIAVVNHLGLINVEQNPLEKDSDLPNDRLRWHFDLKFRANEKGMALWKDFDQTTKDTEILIAKRELVEITGITKYSENQAIAEIKTKLIPNSIGKAFQEGTEEFNVLPEQLRLALSVKTLSTSGKHLFNWNEETTSKVIFQRYDDGWRFERLMF